jgi:hypothetical protein
LSKRNPIPKTKRVCPGQTQNSKNKITARGAPNAQSPSDMAVYDCSDGQSAGCGQNDGHGEEKVFAQSE